VGSSDMLMDLPSHAHAMFIIVYPTPLKAVDTTIQLKFINSFLMRKWHTGIS